ncbi:MAG: tetratricopeptide repeat protein [bacterium]
MITWHGNRLCLLCLGLLLLGGCIPDQGVDSQGVKDTGISVEEKYMEKGIAYYKNGNLDPAILLFAECLKLNPNNQKARKLFEEALKMKGGEEKGAEKIPLEEGTQASSGKTTTEGLESPILISPPEQLTETIPPISAKKNVITKKPPALSVDAANLEPLITQQKGSVEKIKKELSSQHKEEMKEPESKPVEKGTPTESKVESRKVIDDQQVKDFNFARDMYAKGLFDAAAAELKTLLDKYPNTILKEKILYLLANALIKAKKYPEAMDTAKRLIDAPLAGEFKNDGLFLLAQAYDESGNLKQAQIEYLKVAMSEKSAGINIAQHIRKFLDETAPCPTPIDELTTKARLSAGDAYKKDGEYERSLFEYHRVINDHPEASFAAEAYFRIGEVYQKAYRVRDFQKAYEAYQKIVKQYPTSPWAKKAKKQADYLWENYLR